MNESSDGLVGKCSFLAPNASCVEGNRRACPVQRAWASQMGRLERPPQESVNSAAMFEWRLISSKRNTYGRRPNEWAPYQAVRVPCVHAADLWPTLGLQNDDVDVLLVECVCSPQISARIPVCASSCVAHSGAESARSSFLTTILLLQTNQSCYIPYPSNANNSSLATCSQY
mmetsp:Transcript_25283/g.62675  ORF Transcript_25283/g.62675 Transcript_25283/m.62675 type:complete len:172 (-) Transcript_25283:419-934(-)